MPACWNRTELMPIWLGFTGKGLVRYKRRTAWTYTKADGFTDTQVTFVFEDKDKTLGEKDIEKVMSELIGQYEKNLGAVIRR